MTTKDLLALSERLLCQLEFNYGITEDEQGLLIPTEDDRVILVLTDECDFDDRKWPVLVFVVVLLTDVDSRPGDASPLVKANADCMFGSVVLNDDKELLLHHFCVGWPGGAEFQVTFELMAASAEGVLEMLGNRISGSAAKPFSEVVS